jgi:hypothetical protein
MATTVGSWSPRVVVASLVLVLFSAAIAGGTIAFAMRIPIQGSVSADVIVKNVIGPGVVILLSLSSVIIYVSLKVVMGRETTNTAISRLSKVVLDAGAMRERRRQDNDGVE